ncbi:MAG: hypothetical protein EWV55_08440 [Microcystis viridis Mv_BB_P_19951000_S69]|uniref:Uncharacterized protein n=1 Tax=Microcystis viridis Mv_BB_P_19951000_S68D TaxID=2486270 RepID=A0A552HSQ7_MICVR|nr:MAG: hypothetical protein EWV47_17740 [Microcystis viridis Mv_BB_P_19951000_S68]TRU74222.1 MAG: hypothetical protein EWV77_10530 [Microcystis viridis Mv_BB_P_19951000_S68D]TRU75777.1 MAG: hypothetical protein EWV55_08440 [Microcystis viridis Mv_BB_P_19951000_S69]TRU80380.1 MAG: hypothetical protein EWV46_23610 [Microcystis viridis Mv_BB_P_19951000_S69D]
MNISKFSITTANYRQINLLIFIYIVSHHFSSQETGDRRQDSGFRRQETGDRRQDSGDRRLFLFILPTTPLPHYPTTPLPHTPHPTSPLPHTPLSYTF